MASPRPGDRCLEDQGWVQVRCVHCDKPFHVHPERLLPLDHAPGQSFPHGKDARHHIVSFLCPHCRRPNYYSLAPGPTIAQVQGQRGN